MLYQMQVPHLGWVPQILLVPHNMHDDAGRSGNCNWAKQGCLLVPLQQTMSV
jgi:hypothetical protein